jgi:SpoVK/Ycf46/Vps4 family AAA+-type ATPase
MSRGHFKVTSKIKLSDLKKGDRIEESDFASMTEDGHFIQMEYISPEDSMEMIDAKPGVFTIVKTSMGLALERTEFIQNNVLRDFVNTKEILEKISNFFKKLDVYEKHKVFPKRGILLWGPPGCHAKGTKILMYDGSVKNVEDIREGELLMGPDSTPRQVLKLASGKETMVKIKPNKGEDFIVNINHILHLTPSGEAHTRTPINMKVSDYLNQTECFQQSYKLTRTGIDFPKKELPIDPYILGNWLGDGTSASVAITTMDLEIKNKWLELAESYDMDVRFTKQRVDSRCETIHLSSKEKTIGKNKLLNIFKELEIINNKHIPQIYLTSSREDRLKLLAGLIDTDGTTGHSDLAISKGKFGTGYSYVSKLERLADDVIYLCRSLGFAAYKSTLNKSCYVGKKEVFTGEYYHVNISGDLSEVPVLLERKKCKERKMNKSVLRTGFKVEILEPAEYYGFTLDKDHLYLTSDFTIHHNTGKTTVIADAVNSVKDNPEYFTLVWHTDKIDAGDVKDFVKHLNFVGPKKMILIIEDIGGVEVDQARMRSESSLLALLDNQEKAFKIPTLILATTNYIENFMGNLTNRPGRFDEKIKFDFPPADARLRLMKFYDKEGLLDEAALNKIASKKCAKFTAAQLQEVIVRSEINSVDPNDVIEQIAKEIETYEKNFNEKTKAGIGMFDD